MEGKSACHAHYESFSHLPTVPSPQLPVGKLDYVKYHAAILYNKEEHYRGRRHRTPLPSQSLGTIATDFKMTPVRLGAIATVFKMSVYQRLQQQLQQLQQLQSKAQPDTLSPSNQSSTDKSILENRIQELKEERADMYKLQSENAQRLVLMNDQLRSKEATEVKQKQELATLTEATRKQMEKCQLQTEQLREKDVTIQASSPKKTCNWPNDGWKDEFRGGQDERGHRSFTKPPFRKKPLHDDTRKSTKKEQDQSKATSTHDGDLYCIQVSPSGKYLATGSEDRKIKLYEPAKPWASTILSGALQSITSIDFNASDEFLVASSTDHSTRVWNLTTKRIAHTLTGHIGKVLAAKVVPADSNRVVTGSHDRTLKAWDLNKGWCVKTIFSFSSCNDVCLMDPDGQTLVSGHLDHTLRLWDVKSGNGIKDLNGVHTDQITSVCVSPDGSSVLTNSRDNTLKIVDLRMYEVIHAFKAPTYQNGLNWSRACFSPDGNYVAAGSKDGSLHIWNTRNNQLERCLKGHTSVISGVTWHPMGTELYSAEKSTRNVCVWDTSMEQRAGPSSPLIH
ncbi:hypothetical protein [Absidia glauca]|uniref:Autophagy-related protein 16 domain-containing protein n=1 Tax=Absidia glauca TaxID=4829 RepID=A0A163KZJ5_ABSGL|nr:hypothetical protein [Absidia glauca]